MKVGVLINHSVLPTEGGGFSYLDKFVKKIDDYAFSSQLEIAFIGQAHFDSQINFSKEYLSLSAIPSLKKERPLRNLFFRKKKVRNHESEKRTRLNWLYQNGIDILYSLYPSFLPFQDFPFILTNWDIGHRSTWTFPEFITNDRFNNRETLYNNLFPKALSIFCESKTGKEELVNYTRINESRVKIVPIFPGGVADIVLSSNETLMINREITLDARTFYFYPAQFWPHKNHYNLIKAFSMLLSDYPNFKLALTGGDKGNLDYIKKLIADNNLSDRVYVLGFVDDKTLCWLYKNAISLVMPTFLGPTNMPLLEAQALGCPVICSGLSGHKEMLGDGAIYFNPLDCSDIYHCMKKIVNEELRNDILESAKKNREKSIFNIESAIASLEKNLLEVMEIRNCWSDSLNYF